MGQSGDFNFSSTSGDVVKYRYEINAQPTGSSREVSASRAGFWLMPSEPGVYTINAQALDAAGNKSDTGIFQVRIGSGRPPVSTWGFDGAAADSPVTLSGDAHAASFPAGERVDGDALVLDGAGDSRVAPSSERVATTYSFAVEAWAYLDAKTPGQAVVVSQSGSGYMDYKLYYSGSGATDHWVFARYTSDRAVVGVGSEVPVRTGRWTHLVGVHNSLTNQLLIYVDGVPSTPRSFSDPVSELGPVTIGAGRYGASANPTSFWPGRIDGVKFYDRMVPAEEAAILAYAKPSVAARWSFEPATVDAAASPVTVASEADTTGGQGPSLTLSAGAGLNQEWWVDEQALILDGVDGYAATNSVPVDTSNSFTLTGWAQAAGELDAPATVMSINGSSESAVLVEAEPGVPGADGEPAGVVWRLIVRDADGSGATVSEAVDTSELSASDWTHLAVVYDAARRTARLVVNGNDADMNSVIENVDVYVASGSVSVGRGRSGGVWSGYWPGQVDDVWLFNGTLSDAQINQVFRTQFGMPTEVPGGMQ